MTDEPIGPGVVQALGAKFKVAEKVGLAPLMRFAKVAQVGTDSMSLEGLAAMYDLLGNCFLDTAEFERFLNLATEQRAGSDELFDVVKTMIEAISARPTGQPTASSDGLRITNGKSSDASYLRVIRQHESEGRPDLALVYVKAQEQRAS